MAIWTPANLSTLSLWLDADDASTLTVEEGRISEWRDKSPFGRALAQGDPALRPRPAAASPGGRGVVRFDGSSVLKEAAAWSAPSAMTVAMLVSYDLWESGHRYNGVFGTPYTSTSGLSFHVTENAEFGYQARDILWFGSGVGASQAPAASAPQAFANGETAIVVATIGGGGNVVRLNGVEVALNRNDVGAIPPLNAGLYVGASGFSNGARKWDGDVGELVFCGSVLGADDMERLEGHIAHRFGVADLLPSSHPFRLTAPTDGAVEASLDIEAGARVAVSASAIAHGPGVFHETHVEALWALEVPLEARVEAA